MGKRNFLIILGLFLLLIASFYVPIGHYNKDVCVFDGKQYQFLFEKLPFYGCIAWSNVIAEYICIITFTFLMYFCLECFNKIRKNMVEKLDERNNLLKVEKEMLKDTASSQEEKISLGNLFLSIIYTSIIYYALPTLIFLVNGTYEVTPLLILISIALPMLIFLTLSIKFRIWDYQKCCSVLEVFLFSITPLVAWVILYQILQIQAGKKILKPKIEKEGTSFFKYLFFIFLLTVLFYLFLLFFN